MTATLPAPDVGDTVERRLPRLLPYGDRDHDPSAADDAQRLFDRADVERDGERYGG